MTIHCVTPNPAIDITYQIPNFLLHTTNRVTNLHRYPGGKGVNVARILAATGYPITTHGLIGGHSGHELVELLTRLAPAIDQQWVETPVPTRSTIAIVDKHDATMLAEIGNQQPEAAWQQLTNNLQGACHSGDWVAFSGSFPPGYHPDHLTHTINNLHKQGCHVSVDTSGPLLLTAAAAQADLLKPNQDELLAATKTTTVDAGAKLLLTAGAQIVVVSLGKDGARAYFGSEIIHAMLNRPVRGNPTGAGDALVAGMLSIFSDHAAPPLDINITSQALITGCTWAAAAVSSPVAGEIDFALAQQLRTDILLKEL